MSTKFQTIKEKAYIAGIKAAITDYPKIKEPQRPSNLEDQYEFDIGFVSWKRGWYFARRKILEVLNKFDDEKSKLILRAIKSPLKLKNKISEEDFNLVKQLRLELTPPKKQQKGM